MLEQSGFLQKAVQVGDEVIFVVAVYETFPAVVHKPALHIRPEHAVRPVVLLQSPVRKRPHKMKVMTRQEDMDNPARSWRCSAEVERCVPSISREWKQTQHEMNFTVL